MILDLVLVDSPMMTDVWRTREPFEWEGRKIWVLAMNRRLPTPAERALCRTAQLRDLSRRLQRAKERSERERLLAQFEAFRLAIAEGHAPARRAEIPPPKVLRIGFEACWTRSDYASIARLAACLPADVIARDFLIGAYAAAAEDRLAGGSPQSGRR